MYVCMYVCMYECMYVGMYVPCCSLRYEEVGGGLPMYMCTYLLYVYVCMYVCMYVCTGARTRIVRANRRIEGRQLYVCIYVCMYVCMYVCIYVCIASTFHFTLLLFFCFWYFFLPPMCMHVCMNV